MNIIETEVNMQKQMRHLQAIAHCDYLHLKQQLLAAASRFSDLADTIEKDRTYDPVGFMRSSAERYKAEAESH